MDEEDIFDEVRRRAEAKLSARESFSSQFIEGAKHSASLGYAGKEWPEGLPLTGKIGRVAGEVLGAAPAFAVGSELLGAVGITGLGAEIMSGAIYGGASKVEEGESRITNAIQDAAGFGAGHLLLKGAGRAVKGVFGKGADEAAGAAGGVSKDANISAKTPDPETYHGDPIFAGQTAPNPEPGGTPFGLFKSPEDLAAYKQKQEDTNFLRDRAVARPDPFMPPPDKLNLGSPDEMQKSMVVHGYDIAVNSWAKFFLDSIPKEEEYLGKVSSFADDDLEAASTQMVRDSVKHALGETPIVETPEVSAVPKLEVQHALQTTIDGIVTKNAIPIETIQAASQTKEPINFLMSKGVNFDDAAKLVDSIAERARTSLEPRPARTIEFSGKNAPKPVPPWEKIKDRSYLPDEVFDLFYNAPFKGAEAFRHGLLERGGVDQEVKLTEKGYAFLKQYNPEGLIGEYPDFISRKSLGAIRGQGFSNLSHSEAELKDLGFKMPAKVAAEKGFIRPSVRNGKEIAGEYQLTDKGAAMLAGGRGANANIDLKAYDQAAGRRLLPGDTEGIAAMSAERDRNRILFGDLLDQTAKLAKGCVED